MILSCPVHHRAGEGVGVREPLLVEVWSDVVCPWCAIGSAHLARALAGFAHAAEVDVVWRSFELDPGGPGPQGDYADHLARRYSTTRAGAQATTARISHAAELAGLASRFDVARPARTFDAHRLLHLARAHGVQPALAARLSRAFLAEGADVADPAVLGTLAAEVGLPGAAVAEVLAGNAYADDVRADEEEGLRRGVSAVPTFLVDRTVAVPGASSPQALLAALVRAWDRRRDAEQTATAVVLPDDTKP